MNKENLNKRQQKLMQWRDYFLLLRAGISKEPWCDKQNIDNIDTWLQLYIMELESDVRHINHDQSEFCRFAEVTNLGKLENNYCTDDG